MATATAGLDAPLAENVTVGAAVKPVPAAVIVRAVTAPPVMVAVAVAPEPPPPDNVTVGAEV